MVSLQFSLQKSPLWQLFLKNSTMESESDASILTARTVAIVTRTIGYIWRVELLIKLR